jgi:hypothetical protein
MASKPPTPGTGKALLVRVQPPLQKRLHDWIKRHRSDGERLTPPEAVRRLVELGLSVSPPSPASQRLKPEGQRRERAEAYDF